VPYQVAIQNVLQGGNWMPYKLKVRSLNEGLGRIPLGFCFVI
jgi:hypothetical protein